MGNALRRLGAGAFHHPWRVLAGWAVVIVLLGLLAAQFMKPTSSTISIPGTEAQKAIDRVSELFPDAGKGSGRIVFAVPDGKSILEYEAPINNLTKQLAEVKGVSQVVSPLQNPAAISEDKTIAYAQLQLSEGTGSIDEATIAAIESDVKNARVNGLTVEMGGDIINQVPGEILGIGEVAGVILALIVLVMTLGSLIAAGMPIMTALVAIVVSMAGLFSLSEVMTISSTTPVLAIMLGLAVGIDYSLFIISKYRSYVLEGFSYAEAAARSIATAGNAVIYAALTVVIALSALTIVNIPFMSTMGLAGAATIAVAAVGAITIIPALLGLAGDRIFRKKERQRIVKAQKRGGKDSHEVSHRTFWYRWGDLLTRRPVVPLLLSILVIGAIALPIRDLTLGLPTDQYAAEGTTERSSYDLLTRGFGAGFNGPLTVVVEGLPAAGAAEESVVRSQAMAQYEQQVAAATAAQKTAFEQKAAQASSPGELMALQAEAAAAQQAGAAQQAAAMQTIEQSVKQYAKYVQLQKISTEIAKDGDVEQTLPALVTDDGTAGIVQVTPKTAPSDDKTSDLILRLRDQNYQTKLAGADVTFKVTGSTALQYDINQKLSAALPLYLGVVVGLSLILLIIAFRSILVPLKATLGFLLSVSAMFGALVMVFQYGWFGIAEAPGPIVSFIPIIAIGVLFGLAMDYEFFLVSSMHESYLHSKDAKQAVADGFGMGSKVVTAAGVIMVSVFAGFIFNHDATIQAIGFGLAVGILIDAFIVRMTIVPAVMSLLGKRAWWLPKWLDRILPHVSIEGKD
jgi:putative drug exporter of the RND superfamily